MPPAGSGPLSTMIMSACAASAGARCPPAGVWRDSVRSRPRTSWAPSRPERPRRQRPDRQGGAGPRRPEATFRRQRRSAGDGCSCRWRVTGGGSCNDTGGRLHSALTGWPMTVRGIVVRSALVNVTAARPLAFLPVWPMFLQHRRRCASTVRWRASLTILAGVVLVAAEGRAS